MDIYGEMVHDIKYLLKQPGVHAIGAVDQLTLAKEQQKAQLMVYPCDTMIPSEGFGMTIGEAFLADCAVLLSDCDAFPEIWGDVVAMLPLPIDYGQWADSVVELLSSKELLQKYNLAGKQKVLTQYNWDVIVKQWDEFLRSINSGGAIDNLHKFADTTAGIMPQGKRGSNKSSNHSSKRIDTN